MKKIILFDFFKEVSDELYCINKRGDIEKYREGSDIDIFCMNIKTFSQKILNIANVYIKEGYEIIVNNTRDKHWHIDFYNDDKLIIRFDLYASMPNYNKINIKESLFSSIVENRVQESINLNNADVVVYYPSAIDEVIIRYLEYIENYQIRPDKVKHLDYIIKKIQNDKDKRLFLDKLHYHTSLPKDLIPKKNNYDLVFFLKMIITKIKTTEKKHLLKKGIKFIKRYL